MVADRPRGCLFGNLLATGAFGEPPSTAQHWQRSRQAVPLQVRPARRMAELGVQSALRHRGRCARAQNVPVNSG